MVDALFEGLRKEDLYAEDYTEIRVAIGRLPRADQIARQQRLLRAVEVDMKNQVLPQEHWTKAAEDIPYLSPVIKKVLREHKDRQLFRSS